MASEAAQLVSAILIFVGILSLIITARVKGGEKFEIKGPDIILALIPIVLWLVLTGKITRFEYADLKIETAFAAASNAAVAGQVSEQEPLEVEALRPVEKGGVSEIPRLIEEKRKALSFRLGHGGYWGPAIEQYLQELTRHPFLKHVIFLNRDETLLGMIGARQLAEHVGEEIDPRRLADWLNEGNISHIESLPGFVSGDQAVTRETRRDEVLEQMEQLETDVLPVVNERKGFVGVVERSRITAAMLIDISRQLE